MIDLAECLDLVNKALKESEHCKDYTLTADIFYDDIISKLNSARTGFNNFEYEFDINFEDHYTNDLYKFKAYFNSAELLVKNRASISKFHIEKSEELKSTLKLLKQSLSAILEKQND